MKLLSWNCQGLANPLIVKALKNWCWRDRPNVVFVMETMISKERLDIVRVSCGFDAGFCLSNTGNLGGFGIRWNGYDITLLSYSANHIIVEVSDPNGVDKWYMCGIYGWADRPQKYKTWDLICTLRNAARGPCLFFGDFNEILNPTEKIGGGVRCESDMLAFRNWVDACELKDLG